MVLRLVGFVRLTITPHCGVFETKLLDTQTPNGLSLCSLSLSSSSLPMSHQIVCLAIVGNQNEPLYLCPTNEVSSSSNDDHHPQVAKDVDDDWFGFSNREWQLETRTNISMRLEVRTSTTTTTTTTTTTRKKHQPNQIIETGGMEKCVLVCKWNKWTRFQFR